MPDQEASNVFTAFDRFVRTRSENEIVAFSRKQLERTLVQFSRDRNHRAYSAIEHRLAFLKETEGRREIKRGRIVDWIIAFISGVLITILGDFFLKWLKLNG